MVKITYVGRNISEVSKLCNLISKMGLISEAKSSKNRYRVYQCHNDFKIDSPLFFTNGSVLVSSVKTNNSFNPFELV